MARHKDANGAVYLEAAADTFAGVRLSGVKVYIDKDDNVLFVSVEDAAGSWVERFLMVCPACRSKHWYWPGEMVEEGKPCQKDPSKLCLTQVVDAENARKEAACA